MGHPCWGSPAPPAQYITFRGQPAPGSASGRDKRQAWGHARSHPPEAQEEGGSPETSVRGELADRAGMGVDIHNETTVRAACWEVPSLEQQLTFSRNGFSSRIWLFFFPFLFHIFFDQFHLYVYRPREAYPW